MDQYSDYLYTTLGDLLTQTNCEISAAQCHGTLAGLLCAPELDHYSVWEQEVIGPAPASPELRDCMRSIFQRTAEQMDSGMFNLVLLLPADDAPLQLRTEALGLWCQGFLYGLSAGRFAYHTQRSPEVDEFLRDLTQLTDVGRYSVDEGDQNEGDYTQIVCYVQSGAHLVKESIPDKKLHSYLLH